MGDLTLTFNSRQAAAAIGVSPTTFYQLCRRAENPLPHFTVGRRVIVPRRELEEWLRQEAARATGAVL